MFCFLVGCEFVFTEFVIGFDCGMFEANDIVFLVFNFGKFVFGRGFEFTIKGVDYFFKTDNRLCVVSGIGFRRKRRTFIFARGSGIHMFEEANLSDCVSRGGFQF